MEKTYKLQADTNNGIFIVDEFDEHFDEYGITDESVLIAALKDCGEEEVIYSIVTQKTIDAILKAGYTFN